MTFAIFILVLFLQFVSLFFVQEKSSRRKPSPNASTSKPAELANDSQLLELGQATKLRTPPDHADLKVISYNIRWRSGDELKQIIKQFREDDELGGPAIIGLQEVDRKKERSGNTNTAKLLAEELGLYYAWAAPPSTKTGAEEETGVAILSIYPLREVRRIVLPHEGPDHRRRVALSASVMIGKTEIRVCSAHAENRISMAKKLDQLNALLADLQHHAEIPAIIMGDLNTWQSDAESRTIKLFTEARFTTPFGSQTTFSRRVLFVPIDLRLDWIWLRGFEAATYGIERKIAVSDHWPLWANLKLQSTKP